MDMICRAVFFAERETAAREQSGFPSRGPCPPKQLLPGSKTCPDAFRMAPGGLGDGLTTFDPPPPPGRRIKATEE